MALKDIRHYAQFLKRNFSKVSVSPVCFNTRHSDECKIRHYAELEKRPVNKEMSIRQEYDKITVNP